MSEDFQGESRTLISFDPDSAVEHRILWKCKEPSSAAVCSQRAAGRRAQGQMEKEGYLTGRVLLELAI